MTKTILITGASGGIGRRARDAFERAGWTVRLYDRSTDLTKAAQGADFIFNGMNPPMYRNWKEEIPRITAEVIAAAKATGATILQPGNVYVYGDQPGPSSEDTPHVPASHKGAIRVEMERQLRNAAKDGVRTILLRAGDFIDAENPNTIFNLVVLKNAAKGRVTATGNPDSRRAYANLTDLARAFVALAERADTLAPYEEINFPGIAFSYRELAQAMERTSGRNMRIGHFQWWALTLARPFWGFAGEMAEMRYLHDLDHRLDGTKFESLLPGFAHADLDTIARAHLSTPARQPQALLA